MIDPSGLYEKFEVARCAAMALTDEYYELEPDDPRRAALWERAIQQTDTTRQLLEAWLQADEPLQTEPQHELVLA